MKEHSSRPIHALAHSSRQAGFAATTAVSFGVLHCRVLPAATIFVGLVAHHLIVFGREAVAGRRSASHYSTKLQEAVMPLLNRSSVLATAENPGEVPVDQTSSGDRWGGEPNIH